MGDAYRGKVKKIAQVQRHAGMSGVVESSAIHHQYVWAVRQLPHHFLQQLSFPKIQESCRVWGTCITPDSLRCSRSPSANYDRGSSVLATSKSGTLLLRGDQGDVAALLDSRRCRL